MNAELTLSQLHRYVIQGKESGDPTVSARGIATGRQGRRVLPVCGVPGPGLLSVRVTLTRKVVLLQERPRDKVRKRVTLSVPASCYVTIGQSVAAWRERWAWLLFVVRMLTSRSDDNGHLRKIIIMCLMDRCQ